MEIDKIVSKNKKKLALVTVILLLGTALAIVLNINLGTIAISPKDILSIISNKVFGTEATVKANITAIVWDIRMPRIITSFFVGAGLATAGVIFQGILQNPLADPYTIGISTGASLGASLAIVANLLYGIVFPVTVAGLIGAVLTMLAVILISRRGNSLDSSNIIISGIIVSSILNAGVSFIKMLAGEDVGAIVFWIMGNFSAVGWDSVALVTPIVILGIIISSLMAKSLDIMSLGDENAISLGVNTKRLRLIYLIIGSLITAVCVSVSGVIGFVGLIVPHLLRLWLTAENKVLMPMSALLGGLLLMTADGVTRVISSGEIPVGVLTTLIGGPFFIYVFTRKAVKNE